MTFRERLSVTLLLVGAVLGVAAAYAYDGARAAAAAGAVLFLVAGGLLGLGDDTPQSPPVDPYDDTELGR